MATKFDNVIVTDLDENGQYDKEKEFTAQIDMSRQGDSVVLCIYKGEEKVKSVLVTKEAEYCRLGKQSLIVTSEDQESTLFKFDSIHNVKSFQFKLKELQQGLSSIFTDRTDEASAVQYFQFYGYLSQQQNMMQDYIRTSTYQRAMLSNINDFLDKVVLDVGAGSGILSFFALQAGARKVYAIEASNMAEYCELPVFIESISSLKKLDGEAKLKSKQLEALRIDATNIEAIMEDPSHDKECYHQFEESCAKIEDYILVLEQGITQQRSVIDMCNAAEDFYYSQFDKTKAAANVYKNFGDQVTDMKKRVDDMKKAIPNMPSPVQSQADEVSSLGNTPLLLNIDDNETIYMETDMNDLDKGLAMDFSDLDDDRDPDYKPESDSEADSESKSDSPEFDNANYNIIHESEAMDFSDLDDDRDPDYTPESDSEADSESKSDSPQFYSADYNIIQESEEENSNMSVTWPALKQLDFTEQQQKQAHNDESGYEQLVRHNKLQDKIIVIPGKVEEVTLPEKVDTIISEPMGYMLFNERMLESFLHAKKWLKPKTGKMYPTQGDLHVAPFTDEALYMEQFSKANFWYQESFHGINLSSLRDAAVKEYFKQPIVDTFDIRMCLAKSIKHTVDFLTADETDLHVIEIPLNFTVHQTGLVHGLAFWFDVAFLGTVTPVWLSTSPTETLTHWYQVRCLVQTPVLVKQGQSLTGKCLLRCNKRQSYDVDIELNIPGTTSISKNSLDLKNPFFRYTGQTPAAQPGTQTQSPSDAYWNTLMTGQTYNTIGALNGNMMNGVIGDTNTLQLQGQIQLQSNYLPMSGAPINPGSIPSVLNLAVNSSANRTSIGGGISPINFSNTQPQNVITGTYNQYPISSQFMIGDYVTPGNLVPLSEQNKS